MFSGNLGPFFVTELLPAQTYLFVGATATDNSSTTIFPSSVV